MDNLVYYTGKDALTEYINQLNAAYPHNKCKLVHCTNCGRTSVHISFPNPAATKAGKVHEHWVSSIYSLEDGSLFPYMSCFWVDRNWIELCLDHNKREFAPWSGELGVANTQQHSCNCDISILSSVGCQCGGK